MASILLLLEQRESRRVLNHWLMSSHEIAAPETPDEARARLADPDKPFDLCFIDAVNLARLGDEIRERRRREHPVFLPFVLLALREDAERAPSQVWEDVDELITVPVLKPELQARVGTVLRTRRLSLLAHAELSQILDSAGSPICVVSHERRISRFNRAFAALVDTAGREIKGALFDEALPWKPFIPELDLLGAVLAGGEVSDAQVAVEDPAGIQPQRVFLVTAAPFRGLDGELLGAILDLKDITKLKQAKADLREHRDRLQQALTELVRVQDHLVRQERLRALGQMAGSMARDFAGTLSVILGHAERLIDEREDVLDAEAAAWLRSIADTARSGAGTVEEILRFTKPRDTADPRKPLDLNEVLEEAIALTRSGWEDEARATSAPIALRRSLGRLPRVLGNEAELREALVNLISNAVDAMPGGGTLAFCTRQEDDTAIIEVSDTGVGMDEETDRRALEPFFTTKGERGTGLGLTMVYGFVKRHHGSMSLKSSPGAGTTVVLRLPLLPDVGAAPGAGVEAKVEATPSERPLHVLVVDDHPMVRDGLKAMLVADGHTVDVAEDGIAGLRAFQRGRHDLVITDKVMPTMGGERLAAFIRTTSPRTPIILVTGYADSDGKRPPSVDVVLQKPVSRDRLRQAIRALVAKSQAQP